MPADLLTLSLPDGPPPRCLPDAAALRPLDAAPAQALARLYLDSYPPGSAAADLEEARTEIAETFAGAFGVLRPDASATVWRAGAPVGAVMVVERSVPDEGLEGPFVIELFVAPQARGLGAGRALMTHAIHACRSAGAPVLHLRIGAGTSPAALVLYRDLGFVPYAGR